MTGWVMVEPASGTSKRFLLGLLGALLDRQGHFLGLAVAETDAAVAVTDHDERGEGEATTALDDLGHAVDVMMTRRWDRRGLCCRVAVAVVLGPAIRTPNLLHGRRRRPRRSGRGREATAVEHDLLDAGGLGALGDQLADREAASTLHGRRCAGRPRGSRRHDRDTGSSSMTWSTRCAVRAEDGQARDARRCRGSSCGPDGGGRAGPRGASGRPWSWRPHFFPVLPALRDLLAEIAHALALVRLGLADGTDVGGHLADHFLVDAAHDDAGLRRGTSKVTPSGAFTRTGWLNPSARRASRGPGASAR
jgi:hypothetical protein